MRQPAGFAFESYVAAAREHNEWWRVVLGFPIVGAIYFAIGVGVFVLIGKFLAATGGVSFSEFSQIPNTGQAIPAYAAGFLAGFIGIWLGLWAVLKFVHRRRFGTLFSPEGRLRWREVLDGVLLGLVVQALSWILLLLIYGTDLEMFGFVRTDLAIGTWALWLLPITALIFIQAASEELFFRGYLAQQFGAWSLNPLVWFAIPTLIFALLHYQPNMPAVERWTYIGYTALLSATFAALVYKTGSISAAIGLHWQNNVSAIAIAGLAERPLGMELWQFNSEIISTMMPMNIVLGLGLFAYVMWRFEPRTART